MWCIGCRRPGNGLARDRVCGECLGSMVEAPPRLVASGVVVRAAYRHTGLARRLVHDLKYRGLVAAARALAPAMVENLPDSAVALVPVPRAVTRRIRLGIDPALELAVAVGRIAGLPVDRALLPPLWQSRHAGKGRDRRTPVRFSARRPALTGMVIVDDVITTGATLEAAIGAIGPGIVGSIAATSAGV